MKITVDYYRDQSSGRAPAQEWINSLDIAIKARIRVRIQRIENGNLGDFRALGVGLFEFRFHFGAGYRLYFGREGESLILLLAGGNKSTQLKDINKAFEYWKKYLEEK